MRFLGCEEIVVECNSHISVINWNNYFPFKVVRTIELCFSNGANWRINIPASGLTSSDQLVSLVEKYFESVTPEIKQIKFVLDPKYLNTQLTNFLNLI